jgi:hypothetical protein
LGVTKVCNVDSSAFLGDPIIFELIHHERKSGGPVSYQSNACLNLKEIDTQLIVVTHNRQTMSAASILDGVTMGSDGVSKLLSVKFEEAAKVAK